MCLPCTLGGASKKKTQKTCVPDYNIQKYTYIRQTEEGDKKLSEYLETIDWGPVVLNHNPSTIVDKLHEIFQAEDGIRDFCLSRGLGDVYKRQMYWLAKVRPRYNCLRFQILHGIYSPV